MVIGEVPEHWKRANTTSVFKNGKEDPRKHRPDSFTSVTGKVIGQIPPEVLYIGQKGQKGDWE